MTTSYDVAVFGAGVFGSWTALWLQRAGLKVALIDAYGAAHSRSSSGGESRIIRMGYGADEIYTRWSHRSLGLWKQLFAETGKPELFQPTGVLWMARENDPYSLATLATLQTVGIKFEQLRRDELNRRYPQINFGDISWAIYEPDSGALLARRAVQTVAEEFVRGGDLLIEAALKPTGSGKLGTVKTVSGNEIKAGTFVFACGPWLPKLFPELLANRIHPTRQEVFFFGSPAGNQQFASPQMPTWIDFGGEFYGLPDMEHRGFKVALDRHGAAIDPDLAERTTTPEILSEVRGFLAERFPALKDAPVIETRVCQYENTSNGNFLIDRHPDFDNVWLVGGGSGHGFKHGPALGEYVAAKITEGDDVEPRFSLATKEAVRQRSVF